MSESDSRVIHLDDRDVTVQRPGKFLFPDAGITKFDLAEYYARIEDTALKYYRDRALSMHRYPDGIEADGFFQKTIPEHFPAWIERATLPKQDGEVTYVVANESGTLAYLADQGCITPHLSLSRVDRPDHPDRMIIDLDPSDSDFDKVRRAALHVREVLEEIELPSFVQTTGSRGLHVVVPLNRDADFDRVRKFSHALCRKIAKRDPDLMTTEQRKNQRGKRVFLDDLRNAYGQTAVAPYAVRARPGAPIATPLEWHELKRPDLNAQSYRIENLFRRLAQVEDPWKNIARHASPLPSVALLSDEV